MTSTAAVERGDVTSGRYVEVYETVTDVDYRTAMAAGDLPPLPHATARGLVVPGGGAVTVVLVGGDEKTLPDPGGAFFWPVQHTGLRESGTDATDVTVIW